MTDSIAAAPDSPLPDAIDPDRALLPPGLQPVEPAYRSVLRTIFLLVWLPFLVGALVLDNFAFEGQPFRGLLTGVVLFLMILVVGFAPHRIWRRLGYRLGDRQLRITKGWLWHTDTIVPFVRVQHIDVARGPIDKLFGTASLIVHTAGTHNSVVSLPGLDPEDALPLRDTIRAEIKTDWQ
ncbi:PH domain-containing protein [Sphingomicrobium sp. XHP0239]|uniref:PH domain-containing protein n=1 Tax=Sphingomicrobium maritimum TaxID=3133972 RepID=UPI0031CC5848